MVTSRSYLILLFGLIEISLRSNAEIDTNDIPEKAKKVIFKKFSRPDKISSDMLEKLFRKILKNKSKYELSYKLIKYSFFTPHFRSSKTTI